MMIGLFIAPLLTTSPAIDGEGAVKRSEAILRQLGLKGKIEIERLTDRYPATKDPCWFVEFATDHGSASVLLDARTERPLMINGPPHPKRTQASNLPPIPQGTRCLCQTLRTLGYYDAVKVGSDVGYRAGPFCASFYPLVHGHPFFNLNPSYTHSISFDLESRTIEMFRACPPLPPVNASNPTIASKLALAKIRDWGHTRVLARNLPAMLDPSTKPLETELGYWKFKGEPKARLVWRATQYTQIKGLPYGLGSVRIFVDALTGQLIEPDDDLWSGNL